MAINRSYLKIALIGIVAVLAAGFFGLELAALKSGTTGDRLLAAALAGIVWLTLAFLAAFLADQKGLGILLFGLQTLAAALPSYRFFLSSPYLLAGAVLLFVFLTWGYLRARLDLEEYLNIRFFRIGAKALPLFISGVAIFSAIYSAGVLDITGFSFSEAAVTKTLESAAPLMRRFIPGFSPEATVQGALSSFVRRQLPLDVPEAAVDQNTAALREKIAELTGIPLRGEDTVSQAVYENAILKLRSLKAGARVVALAVIGVLIFLTIKGVAFFIQWVIMLLGFLFYHALLMLNFFSIGFETREKEVIVMK